MTMHTRRDLLRTSLLAGGALCAPRVWGQTPSRSYTAGRYALLVGGRVAWVDSVNILSEPKPAAAPNVSGATPAAASAAAVARASTGAVAAISPAVKTATIGVNQLRAAYQFSFASTVWFGGSQQIANWVIGAVNHVPTLQDGSVLYADFNNRIVNRIDWTGGAISQVTLPGCDVTSTSPAFPVMTVDAATMHWTKGDGSSLVRGLIGPKQKSWRASDFVVTSTANINASRIASVSPLTLAPAVYGGTVALGYSVGAEGPILLTPFQAALQAGGMPMPGLSTDLAIQYGAVPGVSVTLHDCRVLSVNGASPRSIVNMSYGDASLSVLAVWL